MEQNKTSINDVIDPSMQFQQSPDYRELIALFNDDERFNDLVKRARNDREERDHLDRVIYAVCGMYASKHKKQLKLNVHAGVETGDVQNEMYLIYCTARPYILKVDNPKPYTVTVLQNARQTQSKVDSSMFGSLSKANSRNKKRFLDALGGKRVSTGSVSKDYTFNSTVANDSKGISTDIMLKSDDDAIPEVAMIDTIIDQNTIGLYDSINSLETVNALINSLSDPVMRIVVASVTTLEEDKPCTTRTAKIRNAKKWCLKNYGIDEHLFDTSLRYAGRILQFSHDELIN